VPPATMAWDYLTLSEDKEIRREKVVKIVRRVQQL